MSEYNPICAKGVLNISTSAGWCKTLGLGPIIPKLEERRVYKGTRHRGGAVAQAGISPCPEGTFKVPYNLSFHPQPLWAPSQPLVMLCVCVCPLSLSLSQKDAATLALSKI